MGIPDSLEYFFLAIVLAASVLCAQAIRVSAPVVAQNLWTLRVLLACLLWLALTGQVAHEGWLRTVDGVRSPLGILSLGAVVVVSVLAFSRFGRLLVERVGPAALVVFQTARVPIEVFAHQLYQGGYAPVQITYAGLNFDIFSGLTAPAMAWLVWRGKTWRAMLLFWNVFCLLLLFNMASLTALSLPTPLRLFANEPTNIFITYPPFVWLPTFLLPLCLLGHLLVFRWLWWNRGSATV